MVKSSQERLWLIGGGVAAFVMVLIGYFLLISPQRSNTQNVRDQVAAEKVQTAALQQHIDELAAQNKDLAKYKSQLAALRLALPSSSGLPDLLRTLQAIGNETLAQVTSFTVGPPTSVTPGGAAVPSATTTTSTPTAPESSASTTASAASGSGIYSLSITAQVSGSTKQLGDFLDQLQSVQPRAVLVSSVTLTSADSGGAGSGATSMQLTMDAFVAPPVVPAATAPTIATPTSAAPTTGTP